MLKFSFAFAAVTFLVVINKATCLSMKMSAGTQKKVAILGASGYTGAELVR